MSILTEITLNHYLSLGGVLFFLGMAGVLLRRNALVIYMSLELMLNSAVLVLAAFGRFRGLPDAQITVFFILTVAAAEVAVGLALVVALFRSRRTLNVDEWMLVSEVEDAAPPKSNTEQTAGPK